MLCEKERGELRNIHELFHTKLNMKMLKPIAAIFFNNK